MPKPKINRSDWRTLPYEHWNALTVLAMAADLNREYYGIETYLPFRNWSIERGMVKRELDRYGAELIRAVFEAAFVEYRPNREYPILTAGFIVSYMLARILPRVMAEADARKRRAEAEEAAPSVDEISSWL